MSRVCHITDFDFEVCYLERMLFVKQQFDFEVCEHRHALRRSSPDCQAGGAIGGRASSAQQTSREKAQVTSWVAPD